MTMPRQQINLYQLAVPRGLAGFSARSLLITLSIVGLALLVVWAYSRWQLAQLQHTVDTINAQREQQQTLQFSAGNAHTMPTDPTQVAELIAQLQLSAAQRKRSIDILNSQLRSSNGFTPRLEALSRRHIAGLWLDHILLTNSGGVASIGGGSVRVELIPQYLHGLAAEQSLSGTAFSEFRIDGRDADEPQSTSNPPATAHRGYRFSASQKQSALPQSG